MQDVHESDHDSEDSNREDHSDNEYPDERSSFDQSDEDNYEHDNDQDYRRDKRHLHDFYDEEIAANKFNSKKEHQLKNSILDKMLRKNGNWNHQNNAVLSQMELTIPLDYYEPEVVEEDGDMHDDDY